MNLPEGKLKLLLERIYLEADGDSVSTNVEDFDANDFDSSEEAFWAGYDTGSVDFAKGLLQFLEGDVE